MLQHPHFLLRQRPEYSPRQVLLCQPGIIRSVKLDDIITKMFEDATDQPIAAGMNFDLYLTLRSTLQIMKAVCLDVTIFERDPAPDEFEIFQRQVLIKGGQVDLRHLVTWMRKFFSELTIVGEE